MANEGTEKDGLFGQSFGDALIDTSVIEHVAVEPKKEDKNETPEKTGNEKETGGDKPVEAFTQHDDGTIEIDEGLQKTINAGKTNTEDDGTIIDKTDKDTGKAPSDSASSDSSPSSSQYLAFAQDRAKEGVFLEFNEADWKGLTEKHGGDEAAALKELSIISMQEMVKQGVDSYKESITDDDRALYEAREKGVPIDKYGKAKHEFDKWSKVKAEDLAEDEKLQEAVVSKGFELRGFSKDEIAEEIDNLKVLEKLKSRAEAVLPLLPKKFKTELTDMETTATADENSRKDKIRQGVAKMKSFVDSTPEIIPGIQLTAAVRGKIMKSMTEPVARDANGNPLNPVMETKVKNPQAFEAMLHYYHQLGMFNIDENGQMKPDFSKITKVAKNETVDSFKNAFESKEKNVSGSTKILPNQEDDDDEFTRAFKNIGK